MALWKLRLLETIQYLLFFNVLPWFRIFALFHKQYIPIYRFFQNDLTSILTMKQNFSRLYMMLAIDIFLALCHKTSHNLIINSLFFMTIQGYAIYKFPGPKLHSLIKFCLQWTKCWVYFFACFIFCRGCGGIFEIKTSNLFIFEHFPSYHLTICQLYSKLVTLNWKYSGVPIKVEYSSRLYNHDSKILT